MMLALHREMDFLDRMLDWFNVCYLVSRRCQVVERQTAMRWQLDLSVRCPPRGVLSSDRDEFPTIRKPRTRQTPSDSSCRT